MFIILTLLTLFGGALAYAGDWLGRKLGKQRLSLFGIRPRYTATLITTVTGCLTVALTVIGMTLANESFRAWITRGDQILMELRANETRLKELQARNAALQSANEQLRAQQERISGELNKLETEYQAQLKQVEQLSGQLSQVRTQLQTTESRLRQANQQIAVAQRTRQQLEEQITAERAQIRALRQAQEALRRQNDEFAQQGASLASENAQLDRENRRLREAGEQLQNQNRQLEQQNRQLESQNGILLDRATSLRLQLTELESAARELAQLANIRLRPIAVQMEEELARTVIPAGLSEVRVRQALQDLLNLADKTARERGAAPASGQPRAVFIPEKRVRLTTGEQIEITESESLEAVLQNIRASNDSVVVIAVSLTNVAQGEPAPIELRLFRNRKVFDAGEEIARLSIDCRPERNPLGQVLAFLQTEVRTRATEAGILPKQERAGAPPTVGETSTEMLLELMEQARQCRSERVLLIVRAAKTTFAGDTLHLKFEVTPERAAGRG
ncbi:MAG: hypothetical protein KatS3mg019_2443 [Fimbriimonadales bacterium]|nr:MAG: hypothetical protein KatS3mg019_2443 [Fimbriimonadales bacterium]